MKYFLMHVERSVVLENECVDKGKKTFLLQFSYFRIHLCTPHINELINGFVLLKLSALKVGN